MNTVMMSQINNTSDTNAASRYNTSSNANLLRPGLLLRLEGLALFVGAIAAYVALRGNGWVFALLLLAPDLAMIGYLRSPHLGAAFYNLAHNMVLPGVLLAGALAGGWEAGVLLALIWLAHIGMDRTVGYGLKYSTAFKDTHLQRV